MYWYTVTLIKKQQQESTLKAILTAYGWSCAVWKLFQLVADSLQNSTSLLKGILCIQECKGKGTTQVYKPHHFHPYQTKDTEVMHHEMKFLLLYKPLSRSRLICFWIQDGKIPPFRRSAFTWNYPSPALHIGLLCSYFVEIYTLWTLSDTVWK